MTASLRNIVNLIFIQITVIFFTGLVSCKESSSPKCYKVKDEVKQWADFKTGSYWIYEEENLGSIDSVYVSGYYDTCFDLEVPNGVYEEILVVFKSSGYHHNNFTNYFTAYGSTVSRCKVDTVAKKQICFNLFDVPPTMKKMFGPEFPTIIDTIFGDYYLGTDKYTNVVKSVSFENPLYDGKTVIFYNCKNFGLIKFEIPIYNESWNLIRYNIMQ